MSLAPFTTNDEVRGVLGVSSEELLDETLELSIYEINLRKALNKAAPTLAATFLTVNGIAVGTRSAVQVTFHDAVRLYSPYVVAYQLTPGLPMLAPKSITDGKAAISKFSESPFKAITAAILNEHDKHLLDLIEAFLGLTGSSAGVTDAPALFKGVSSGTDRVTGLAR